METDKTFFYEERKKPKNVQLAVMVRPEFRDRIDAARMNGEKRSATIRRILEAGLPIVERQTKLMRSQQARLAPIENESRATSTDSSESSRP